MGTLLARQLLLEFLSGTDHVASEVPMATPSEETS